MAPINNNEANILLQAKRSNDDDSDEGFVSPSVGLQRIGLKNRKDTSHHNGFLRQRSDGESESNSSSGSNSNGCTNSDTDSQNDSSPSSSPPKSKDSPNAAINNVKDNISNEVNQRIPTAEGTPGGAGSATDSTRPKETTEATNVVVTISKDAVEKKAESLAQFIVNTLVGKVNGSESNDPVERTLLKCVRMMMEKHHILFKGMMKRVQITQENGYTSFVTVANALFEEEKMIITWSRIVALYAFGGQLAMHCQENDMKDFACTIAVFMGKYAKEVLTPFVMSIGGWDKICEEFPEETDIENKIRRLLSWTAVGLGVAATVSYLTSR